MPKKFAKDGGKIILENTRRTKTSSTSEEEKYLAYLREREEKKLASNPPQPVITEEKVEPKVEMPEVQPEISVVAPDPMDRYRSALKHTPSSTNLDGSGVVYEQDLQNTPASMKDLKNVELSIRNIQTSLTSLGGGGLGAQDVLQMIVDNSTDLSDSDLDYIASRVGDDFLDSAEAVSLITHTVDSAYVSARVDANLSIDVLDSAETIKIIEDTVPSMIDSSMDSVLSDLGMDASPTNGSTDDF